MIRCFFFLIHCFICEWFIVSTFTHKLTFNFYLYKKIKFNILKHQIVNNIIKSKSLGQVANNSHRRKFGKKQEKLNSSLINVIMWHIPKHMRIIYAKEVFIPAPPPNKSSSGAIF